MKSHTRSFVLEIRLAIEDGQNEIAVDFSKASLNQTRTAIRLLKNHGYSTLTPTINQQLYKKEGLTC